MTTATTTETATATAPFRTWVRAERERLGVSMTDLALEAGATCTAVRQFETRGGLKPRPHTVRRYREALTRLAARLAAQGAVPGRLDASRHAGGGFAVWLRDARARARMTAAEVAAEAGVAPSTVHAIERGHQGVGTATAAALRRVFHARRPEATATAYAAAAGGDAYAVLVCPPAHEPAVACAGG